MDSADPGRVAAVLDWELSTIGDPLADLGLLLFYWAQQGEPAIPLVPNITSSDGFPPRSYLLARYAQRTGIDVSTVPFYEAFARFKFAVIIQGVTRRSALGMMAGQDFGNLDAEVVRLAGAGLDALEVA
jgi:aminoglycoside phosphotransferase (APT) family kinase protein